MVSTTKDGLGNSTISSPLPKPPLSTSNPIGLDADDVSNGEKPEKKRFGKRSSVFHLRSRSNSGADALDDEPLSPGSSERPNSPLSRPRTLHKGKPTAAFGSLGRKSVNLLKVNSPNSPPDDTPGSSIFEGGQSIEQMNSSCGDKVLHHGEVQTASSLFRKKKEYLVLTETHLIRYKTQSRASEGFPSIGSSYGRSSRARHASTTSIGSLQDLQSLNPLASTESESAIPLNQIVTAYKVEDGRPFFTTEVVYLDEERNLAGSVQLMLSDPREADLWHTSIRGAAQKARLISSQPYPERVVHYLVNVLEAALDYDEAHFAIFRVVRRALGRTGARPASEDFSKIGSSVSYMVIGINQLHLISLPDFAESPTNTLDAKASKTKHGLVSLISLDLQNADDTFQIGFRMPLEAPLLFELAAFSSPEIAAVIFRAVRYLKPLWLDYTFLIGGPRVPVDEEPVPISSEADSGGFDRTLVAYCAAYKCNAVNIQYAIDLDSGDAPEFRLMPPAHTLTYSILELLAIFRALRYNESFRSISFQGIDLQKLHGLHDSYGEDHVAWTSRSGHPIRSSFNVIPGDKSLLYQEAQALALKTQKVRRFNFSDTLTQRRPRDDVKESEIEDPGCELTAALLPLCRRQLTSVDWLAFNGIELGEADLAEIVLALDERRSHFRCIEVSRCALSDRALQVFLSYLERQNATIECINIANNPGRVHLVKFSITMSRFSQIRKLDLSRMTGSGGVEPLITPEIMLSWRLEEMILTGIPINKKTLEAISTYLGSHMSDGLKYLQMDQCHLTGSDVAVLLRLMSRKPGEARNLNLDISANRLEKGCDDMAKAVEKNETPAYLTMRMVEYHKEAGFRKLLQALRWNKTIRSLDISKTSLPYDASDDTCEALQLLFEDNETLEKLDISGERAHLETARFGIGLNFALNGLKKNKALKVLRIEYQSLGLEGANILSSVLEINETLTHIYCDCNDINLQGYTVLVNTLSKNFNVLSLPLMLNDRSEAVKRLTSAVTGVASSSRGQGGVKLSMRRTLNTIGMHLKEIPPLSLQAIEEAAQILDSRWQDQADRLCKFLARNQNIAAGLETRDGSMNDGGRELTTMKSHLGMTESTPSSTMPSLRRANPEDMTQVDGMGRLTIGNDENENVNGGTTGVNTKQSPAANNRSGSLPQVTTPIPTSELGEIHSHGFEG